MKDVPSPLVLISGAGASGLTLAIELARRNIPFRLIDKLDAPFPGSRGKGIQPRTQEVFDDLGVIDRIFAVGGEYPPQREYEEAGAYQDSPVMEGAAPTIAEPYGMALMVPQFQTERVLRDRLSELGHEVQFGCELAGFEDDGDSVLARLNAGDGEEELRVAYLVGADGGRSFVRRTLGVEFPGKTLGIRALVADVTMTGVSRDAWHRWGRGDMAHQISACPLAGTDLFQIQGPVPLEGDVDLSVAGLNQILVERSGRDDLIVQSVSWASAFTMNARMADRYRIGRIFLVGDAAHVHPPTGGQGLNTSVQDAYNLGWKLAAVLRGAPAELLDTYEEERQPIAAGMLGLSTHLLARMTKGELKRGRDVQQLDLSYRGSSLAQENAARCGGLVAGDRAPDARFTDGAGKSVRLFDVSRGPHWTLILYGGPDRKPATSADLVVRAVAAADLADCDKSFASAYGLADGGSVLIRPDGYIGLVLDADDATSLGSYLESVGVQG